MADGFSGVHIQNDRQINKAYQEMDVSNVSHPQLVDAIHCPVFDQVGINPKIMVAIGCADPFALAWPADPALLTHDPGDFLVIDDAAFAL